MSIDDHAPLLGPRLARPMEISRTPRAAPSGDELEAYLVLMDEINGNDCLGDVMANEAHLRLEDASVEERNAIAHVMVGLGHVNEVPWRELQDVLDDPYESLVDPVLEGAQAAFEEGVFATGLSVGRVTVNRQRLASGDLGSYSSDGQSRFVDFQHSMNTDFDSVNPDASVSPAWVRAKEDSLALLAERYEELKIDTASLYSVLGALIGGACHSVDFTEFTDAETVAVLEAFSDLANAEILTVDETGTRTNWNNYGLDPEVYGGVTHWLRLRGESAGMAVDVLTGDAWCYGNRHEGSPSRVERAARLIADSASDDGDDQGEVTATWDLDLRDQWIEERVSRGWVLLGFYESESGVRRPLWEAPAPVASELWDGFSSKEAYEELLAIVEFKDYVLRREDQGFTLVGVDNKGDLRFSRSSHAEFIVSRETVNGRRFSPSRKRLI